MSNKKALIMVQSLFLFFFVSCGEKEQVTCFNEGSVVNGKEIRKNLTLEVPSNECGATLKVNGTFPSVVSLRTSKGLCTGTFINDHTILTAAHCFSNNFDVDSNGQVDVSVSVIEAKAVSTQVIINREYFLKERDFKYDQALVFVPKGTSKDFLKIYDGPFEAQEKIYSVGYGSNRKQGGVLVGSGEKRWGENVIDEIKDDFIVVDGTSVNEKSGVDVSLGHGDSGGPLIYKNKVLGIASNILVEDRITSSYVRVDGPETKKFLKKAVPLYNPNLKNNQKSFLQLCKNPKLQTEYYKKLMAKILMPYNLKKCEDLSYHYPLYSSIDLSFVDLKKITADKLLGGIKLFKNVRSLKLNNTGLKSLELFKEMKDLELLEIKNNPFEDFDSINHFKKLKSIQLDNKSILIGHPLEGLNLQGKWKTKCHLNKDTNLYMIGEITFSSIYTEVGHYFIDEKCTKKAIQLELKGDFRLGRKNENYSEIDLKINYAKTTKFNEDGTTKEEEVPFKETIYGIFKIEGNQFRIGDSKGFKQDQRRLRPKLLEKDQPYFRVAQ